MTAAWRMIWKEEDMGGREPAQGGTVTVAWHLRKGDSLGSAKLKVEAPSSTRQTLRKTPTTSSGVPRTTFTLEPLATNLEVPLDSLRFENSLEQLTELRQVLYFMVTVVSEVKMQIRPGRQKRRIEVQRVLSVEPPLALERGILSAPSGTWSTKDCSLELWCPAFFFF